MVLPALLTILLIALFPRVWTFWESLHMHDLRMPWLGRPFIGLKRSICSNAHANSTLAPAGFSNHLAGLFFVS